jgi:hypothetical protein
MKNPFHHRFPLVSPWIFRQNVVEIAAGHRAFAVRRGDGTVISWGDELLGGDCSAVPKLRLWRFPRDFMVF